MRVRHGAVAFNIADDLPRVVLDLQAARAATMDLHGERVGMQGFASRRHRRLQNP